MRVVYVPIALRQLKELPAKTQKRVSDKIDFYAAQKEPLKFAKRLAGYEVYRFRVGDYRVVFEDVCKHAVHPSNPQTGQGIQGLVTKEPLSLEI